MAKLYAGTVEFNVGKNFYARPFHIADIVLPIGARNLVDREQDESSYFLTFSWRPSVESGCFFDDELTLPEAF
jgi:hypothetical protein